MLERRYSISMNGRTQPLPISALMQAANLFGCNIYIAAGPEHFNVKNYDELLRGIQPVRRILILCFDGADEKEEEVKFQNLFGGFLKTA